MTAVNFGILPNTILEAVPPVLTKKQASDPASCPHDYTQRYGNMHGRFSKCQQCNHVFKWNKDTKLWEYHGSAARSSQSQPLPRPSSETISVPDARPKSQPIAYRGGQLCLLSLTEHLRSSTPGRGDTSIHLGDLRRGSDELRAPDTGAINGGVQHRHAGRSTASHTNNLGAGSFPVGGRLLHGTGRDGQDAGQSTTRAPDGARSHRASRGAVRLVRHRMKKGTAKQLRGQWQRSANFLRTRSTYAT